MLYHPEPEANMTRHYKLKRNQTQKEKPIHLIYGIQLDRENANSTKRAEKNMFWSVLV